MYSTKYLFLSNQIIIKYICQKINLEIEIWSLFCMDLKERQMKSLISALPQYLWPPNWESSNLRWGDPILTVTWPCDYVVTWQIQKTYICTFAIRTTTKLGRVVTCSGGPNLQSLVTFWSHGYVTNSKKLYLHFCNTYGHQTWQGGNLASGRTNTRGQVTFWSSSYVRIAKPYIYTSAIPMATKLGRVVT